MRKLPAAAVLALLLPLAACSTGTIEQSEVEQQVTEGLVSQAPDLPDPDISCPGDLDLEEGASFECTLTVEGDDTELPVEVTVESVDGDEARLDFQVGEPEG